MKARPPREGGFNREGRPPREGGFNREKKDFIPYKNPVRKRGSEDAHIPPVTKKKHRGSYSSESLGVWIKE